jgi:hypothetical protein
VPHDPTGVDATRPADVLHSINGEDKAGRLGVHQWAPEIDPVTGEPLAWGQELAATMAGHKFILPDFVTLDGGGTDVRAPHVHPRVRTRRTQATSLTCARRACVRDAR